MIDKRVKKQPNSIEVTPADKKTLEAFRVVSATEEGRLLLKWIMVYCGFKNFSLVQFADGRIGLEETMHNEVRRGLWLHMRRFIPWNQLNKIEAERKPENDNRKTDSDDAG